MGSLHVAFALFSLACGQQGKGPAVEKAPVPGSDHRRLEWLDREGNRIGTLGVEGRIVMARMSPDGGRLAYLDGDGRIWVKPLVGGTPEAFNSERSSGFAWGPDSTRIASDSEEPSPRLYLREVSGEHAERGLAPTGIKLRIADWSADGQYLTYEQDGAQKKTDIWLLLLQDEATPIPQVSSNGIDEDARFSPDSLTIAYSSETDGRPEVFVRSFPVPAISTRVSAMGGRRPRWNPSGTELFYESMEGTLMVASITPSPMLAVSGMSELFPLRGAELQQAAPDGRRLLVLSPAR